ncbi:MAG: hypothetical protein ABSD70_06315 [Terracidiphilus sp.]|jgi:hypothetical protein
MVQAGRQLIAVPVLLCCSILGIHPQDPASPLDATGETMIDGRSQPYLIRHLPVNAFPELPPAIATELTRRGCLIPQTYEAHRPENVAHASLEHKGSSDWAVLCSVNGTVSLLVFLASSNGEPTVVAAASEISRLQAHGSSAVLGFNWGIDPVSPEQVHVAQLGMRHPPPRLDHDALADSIIDQKTIYRVYTHGTWTTIDTQD